MTIFQPSQSQTAVVFFFLLVSWTGISHSSRGFAQENVTFDDFKFDIEKGQKFRDEMITDEIREFVGKKIKIRGYILPSSKSEFRQFILVRDNMECCFGPGALIYDNMVVRLKKGMTTRFTVRPVTVEGEFRIKLLGPEDEPLSVYEIRGDEVR